MVVVVVFVAIADFSLVVTVVDLIKLIAVVAFVVAVIVVVVIVVAGVLVVVVVAAVFPVAFSSSLTVGIATSADFAAFPGHYPSSARLSVAAAAVGSVVVVVAGP